MAKLEDLDYAPPYSLYNNQRWCRLSWNGRLCILDNIINVPEDEVTCRICSGAVIDHDLFEHLDLKSQSLIIEG